MEDIFFLFSGARIVENYSYQSIGDVIVAAGLQKSILRNLKKGLTFVDVFVDPIIP